MAGVSVALLAVYCLTSPGNVNAVDSWPALGEAAALVDRGSVGFADLDPVVYGDDVRKVLHHATANTAEPTNKYGFGLHVLLVPAYLAARIVSAFTGAARLEAASFTFAFVNPVAAAATAACVLALLVRLGCSIRRSLWTTLAVGLGSFAWPLSGISYFDPVQTALVAAVLLQAVRTRQSGRTGDAWLLGGLVVLAVLSKLAMAPLVGIASLVAIRSAADLRRYLAAGVVSVLVLVAAVAAVNTARFGDPWTSGYEPEQFAIPWLRGLKTLFLSFDRGLVWFFPLLPAALYGLVRLGRSHGRIAVLLALASATYVAMHVTYRHLHGGHCLGPRYLLPLMPILAVGLAESAGVVRGAARPLAGALALGICILWTAPMATSAYFLVDAVRHEVDRAGGTPLDEPVPVTTARLVAAKGITPPDDIPLASFSSSPVAGSVRFAARDNGGFQWWWVKPHPRLPAALRFGAALVIAALAAAGAREISAACARGRRATDRTGAAPPARDGASTG